MQQEDHPLIVDTLRPIRDRVGLLHRRIQLLDGPYDFALEEQLSEHERPHTAGRGKGCRAVSNRRWRFQHRPCSLSRWEFGGSVEYAISPAFGFRVTIDSMHTHFFNLSGAVQGQNDIRVHQRHRLLPW